MRWVVVVVDQIESGASFDRFPIRCHLGLGSLVGGVSQGRGWYWFDWWFVVGESNQKFKQKDGN